MKDMSRVGGDLVAALNAARGRGVCDIPPQNLGAHWMSAAVMWQTMQQSVDNSNKSVALMGTMEAPVPPMIVEQRQARPALDEWLNKNRITNERFGEAVGVSREAVRKWRLPFNDPRRLMPGRDVMPKIFAATQKVITPADFYPPELTGEAAQPQTMEAGR
jgi:hypothetical protein